MPTTKEFKTFEEQVEGLTNRKLKFKRKKNAKKILSKYNYFDIINGFESILLKPGTATKEYKNIFFEDFFDLYKFDMELRNLTLSKVFDIESRLRTSISYNFAKTHCSTAATTMNYTDPRCYQAPNPKDSNLCNRFQSFDLFRKTQYSTPGVVKNLSYIDNLKREKDYINKYIDPPFWVVIKTMPFGTLYYTFLFLDNTVKPCVLNDFGFSIATSSVFEQSFYILKEVRNLCAHLELISRFRLKRTIKMNYFNDITSFAGLSKTHELNYMDVTRNFKLYGNISDIKWIILKFYVKMIVKGRRKIASKILGKMGHKSIVSWILL